MYDQNKLLLLFIENKIKKLETNYSVIPPIRISKNDQK